MDTRRLIRQALLTRTSKVQWWEYEDSEGKKFWLQEKITTTMHSPYSGKGFPGKPKKYNPLSKPEAQDVGSKIKEGFAAVKDKTGRNRILISDLQKECGVPMTQLHTWLTRECEQHRANPSRGEFTAATEEQKKGALVLDGDPHLYIELL